MNVHRGIRRSKSYVKSSMCTVSVKDVTAAVFICEGDVIMTTRKWLINREDGVVGCLLTTNHPWSVYETTQKS
jgi:hypothetical protein